MSLSASLANYFEQKLMFNDQSKIGNVADGSKFFSYQWDGNALWIPSHSIAEIQKRKQRQVIEATKSLFSWLFTSFRMISDAFGSSDIEMIIDDSEPIEDFTDKSVPLIEPTIEPSANDRKLHFYESSERVQVYRPISPRAVTFVILDIIANYSAIFGNRYYISLSVIIFAYIVIFVIYCFLTKPPFIRDIYHGKTINAMLGLRCDCPPARYLRMIPTWVVCISILFKFAVWLMIAEANNNGTHDTIVGCVQDINTCWFDPSSTDTNHDYDSFIGELDGVDYCGTCSGTLTMVYLIYFVPMLSMIEVFSITSSYADLTSAAQNGVLALAMKYEIFHHPLTEEILTKAEIRYGYVADFRHKKKFAYVCVCALGVAIGILVASSPGLIQSDHSGKRENHLSSSEGYSLCIVGLLTSFMTIMIAEVAYSLSATYYSCLCRLHLISDCLSQILSDALEYTHIASGTQSISTKQMARPVIDDIDFAGRLHAWFRARRFYMDLIFPLSYSLCNVSLVYILISFISMSIYCVIDVIEQSRESSLTQAIKNIWPLMYITTGLGACVIIVMAKASELCKQSSNQVRLIESFIMESKMAKQSHHSSQKASIRNLAPTNDWWLSSESSSCGLDVFVAALTDMSVHAKKYDEPATVLGIPVTPLLLSTTIGYASSGIIALALSLLHSKVMPGG